MDRKAIEATLEDLQNCYDAEFSKERRDNGTSGVLYDAKTTIESLVEELDNARALHREEQVRSADRLKIAVDMLKKIGTPVYAAKTEEAALVQIEVEAMAVEALDEIKKVGVGS